MRELSDKQRDQIKGVFFGQAIGDALGLGSEFMSKEEVLRYYPKGLTNYEQIVQDTHRSRWNVGSWTDDTDQFLCIYDSIIESGRVDEKCFAKHLYKWFKGVPMGIGDTVRKVLSVPGFIDNPVKAAELIWKMGGRRNASNGAIMRGSILGTFNFWDIERVKVHSEVIAKVTHADPRAIDACVLINSIIAYELKYGKSVSREYVLTLTQKLDDRLLDFVTIALNGELEKLELDDPADMGYVLKTMGAGLWAYFNALSFEEGVVKIVNQGGDADTNAAVAGALLGAKFGYSQICIKYVEGLLGGSLLENTYSKYVHIVEQQYKKS